MKLKNELNAVIHFVKFLKRSRNLAVTDPDFNATLENVRDIVMTFSGLTFNPFQVLSSEVVIVSIAE